MSSHDRRYDASAKQRALAAKRTLSGSGLEQSDEQSETLEVASGKVTRAPVTRAPAERARDGGGAPRKSLGADVADAADEAGLAAMLSAVDEEAAVPPPLGVSHVVDGLDAEASNASLDAVRATYVRTVMRDESSGGAAEMQHHLARTLLLGVRPPWFRVSVADLRAAMHELGKVRLQRKIGAHSARRPRQTREKREALAHYCGMLDYMIGLLSAKCRLMRFALMRRAFRSTLEQRNNFFAKKECRHAAATIQRYYRAYRVRALIDLCASLQQQVREPRTLPACTRLLPRPHTQRSFKLACVSLLRHPSPVTLRCTDRVPSAAPLPLCLRPSSPLLTGARAPGSARALSQGEEPAAPRLPSGGDADAAR